MTFWISRGSNIVKVAYDHQIFCRQPYGGISRYFTSLAEDMAAQNVDARIFAPWHINRYLADQPQNWIHGRFVPTYPKGLRSLAKVYNTLEVNRQLNSWAPDIVHETFYSWQPSINRHTTVTTVYDMISELFPESFKNPGKMTYKKRKALDRADHIICISENTRTDLLNLFPIAEDKVSVVHLGCDTPSLSEHESFDVLPSDAPYIIYVGLRGGYKNCEALLRAVAASTHLKNDFNILCFGGGDFSTEEQRMIAALGFREGQVKQTSGSDQWLHHCMRHASTFVFPSLYEGFGMPPLEAMASDCPVVCSNVSSMPEVVGDAAEYFDPTSTEDLARAIEYLVYNPEVAAKLVLLGRQRLSHFTWDKCAKQTKQVYTKLI